MGGEEGRRRKGGRDRSPTPSTARGIPHPRDTRYQFDVFAPLPSALSSSGPNHAPPIIPMINSRPPASFTHFFSLPSLDPLPSPPHHPSPTSRTLGLLVRAVIANYGAYPANYTLASVSCSFHALSLTLFDLAGLETPNPTADSMRMLKLLYSNEG
jgi:hypothetical protein